MIAPTDHMVQIMSFASTFNAFQATDLTAGQKLVLTGIATFASQAGKCWPSVQTIAARCSLSVRTVQRHIAALVNMGYLERTYRAGRAAVTWLRIGSTYAKLSPPPLPNCHPEPVTGTCQQNTAPLSILSEPVNAEAGTANAAIVVFDSIKPEVSQPAVPVVNDLPVVNDAVELAQPDTDLPVNAPKKNLLGLPDVLREDFAAVRKAKKKAPAVTKTEAIVFAAEAKKAGLTVAEAVTACIHRGWARFEAHWLPNAKPVEAAVRYFVPEVQQVVRPEVISAAKAAMAAALVRMQSAPTDPLKSAKKIMADHRAGVHINAARLEYARVVMAKAGLSG